MAVRWSFTSAGLVCPPCCCRQLLLLARKRRDADTPFLAAWILLFFGGCMLIFSAGAARYMLPMAGAARAVGLSAQYALARRAASRRK